jgi:hypothetical protein
VHRVLKPANIMMASTGAKLLDFGLTRQRFPAFIPRVIRASEPVSYQSAAWPGAVAEVSDRKESQRSAMTASAAAVHPGKSVEIRSR